MKLSVTFVTMMLTAVSACASEMPAPLPAAASVQPEPDIKSVASDPTRFIGKTVTLSGTLANQGKNYFTDLVVILNDEKKENFIYVEPWLPTSVPPALPGIPARETLADYLDQKVELSGTLRFGELRRVGEAHFLEVTSARILPKE